MVKLVCNQCETRHCEYKTSRPIEKKSWDVICPLMNQEQGPVPAEWREAKNRGD